MDLPRINGLDLFSGIGGLSRALEPWVRTVAYCENDRYAQAVLLSRMRDGTLEHAPIWDDVNTLSASRFGDVGIDFLSGGFPCQDISVAGTGTGLDGSRSGLFFQIVRLARELRPRFIFLENVPAITVRGLDRVLLEFTALGYDCRWTIVSAAEMGAPHLRERWFLLAHARSLGLGVESEPKPGRKRSTQFGFDGAQEHVADSAGPRDRRLSARSRREGQGAPDAHRGGEALANTDSVGGIEGKPRSQIRKRRHDAFRFGPCFEPGWWATEPDVGRVAHGITMRVDRLRCCGNGVVPIQAREAFMRLMGIDYWELKS